MTPTPRGRRRRSQSRGHSVARRRESTSVEGGDELSEQPMMTTATGRVVTLLLHLISPNWGHP